MAVFDEKINATVSETERFLAKVAMYKNKAKCDKYACMGCPESAAVLRSSMDLTRALVEVRKTRH